MLRLASAPLWACATGNGVRALPPRAEGASVKRAREKERKRKGKIHRNEEIKDKKIKRQKILGERV